MANLVERHEERIVFGGTANLAAPDFSRGLREVLQALEEQVVLMRLLSEATDESLLTVLIGTENLDGSVFEVNPTTGATTQVGSMGGSFVSSGDLVSVDGFGTVQTVPGSPHDVLVRLAPMTFAATPIGTSTTGFDNIWGLGFWKGKVFGFTNAGELITIDPNTGVGTMVASGGPGWYGAAVTTTAPVIP